MLIPYIKFQDPISNCSWPHAERNTHAHTNRPKPICSLNFFEDGGIKINSWMNIALHKLHNCKIWTVLSKSKTLFNSWSSLFITYWRPFEPSHDKSNKMMCTQWRLRSAWVDWSESSLGARHFVAFVMRWLNFKLQLNHNFWLNHMYLLWPKLKINCDQGLTGIFNWCDTQTGPEKINSFPQSSVVRTPWLVVERDDLTVPESGWGKPELWHCETARLSQPERRFSCPVATEHQNQPENKFIKNVLLNVLLMFNQPNECLKLDPYSAYF